MALLCASMSEHFALVAGSVSRRSFLRSAGMVLLAGSGLSALAGCGSDGQEHSPDAETGLNGAVALYRQEGCSCCAAYADYLREQGYSVDVSTLDDLASVRERYRIPKDAVGCHTSILDGYVVEGHVPVEAIKRLLSERPALDGISVVGMPVNSPGMGQPNGEALDVLSFRNGRIDDFMSVTTF